jgi:hypothetical protein
VFLPVKDATAFTKTLTAQGMKTKALPGLLLASQTPEMLAAAEAQAGVYKRIKQDAIKADARLLVRMDAVMQAFGPMIQMGMDAATAKMNEAMKPGVPGQKTPASPPPQPEDMVKIVKLEARGFYAMLTQSEEIQIDLTLEPAALSTDTRLKVKPGTAFAELAAMPTPAANTARGLLTRSGYMNASYQLDPARLGAFMTGLIKELGSDPDATAFLTPDVLALISGMPAWFKGDVVYSMASTAQSPMSMQMAMSVSDEAKTLAMIEKSASLLAPGSAFGNMYQSMGIKMSGTLSKNVRKHGAVPVHRFKFTFDAKNAPAAQAAQMKAMLRDMELAVTHGFYVASQDPAVLDQMIDRALAGGAAAEPLASMKAFGEGRHFYVDYDFVGLMKAMATTMPDMPAEMKSLPAGSEPITMAGTLSGGELRGQMRMPLAPFVAMAKMSKAKPATDAPTKK